jgi:hypothetical protein
MNIAKADLAQKIYHTSRITGSFRLRSGTTSEEYFDKYLFESNPKLLQAIAQALLPLIPENADALAGLELGGIPLATVLSQISGLPTLFVRKAAKQYGTCNCGRCSHVWGTDYRICDCSTTGRCSNPCGCVCCRSRSWRMAKLTKLKFGIKKFVYMISFANGSNRSEFWWSRVSNHDTFPGLADDRFSIHCD